MSRRRFVAPVLATALALACVGFAVADVPPPEPVPQPAPAPAPTPVPTPTSIPHGQKDISKAPAGTYTLDPNHVGLIARVSHLDFSYSVFRFGAVHATLDWAYPDVAHSKLSVAVETASIETNVPNFAEQLAGAQYLNSAAFPEASFVSTAFHRIDATHGKVDGNFTLLGKTKPVTFDVTLVGAGVGFAGGPVIGHVIGVHAETRINPQDYGMSPFFTVPIEIVVDTEFDKKS